MYTHKPLHCSLIQILTKFSIPRNDDQCIYSQTRSKCIRFIALLVIFADNLVNAMETSNTRMYFWFLTFWHKIAYRVFWLMKTKLTHFLLASSMLSLREYGTKFIGLYLDNFTCNEKNRVVHVFKNKTVAQCVIIFIPRKTKTLFQL